MEKDTLRTEFNRILQTPEIQWKTVETNPDLTDSEFPWARQQAPKESRYSIENPYSIERFTDEAKTKQPFFLKIGKNLADLFGGNFSLGPPKDNERIQEIIREGYRPQFIRDYLRGVILLRDNETLLAAREKLRNLLNHNQPWIIECIDRYAHPSSAGYRGIFLYVQLDYHIAEIQIHTQAYWNAVNKDHDVYKKQRTVLAHGNDLQDSPDVIDAFYESGCLEGEFDAYSQEIYRAFLKIQTLRRTKLQAAAEQSGVNDLVLDPSEWKNSCTYPLRPVKLDTGANGYMIPTSLSHFYAPD